MKTNKQNCIYSGWRRYTLNGATLLIMALCAKETNGQTPLAGSYTVSSTSTGPGIYSSLASAISSLNTNGVSAPVIININAGYTETAPSGGFVLTATGNSTNTITFQKNGTGTNPLLYAATGGTVLPNANTIQNGVWSLNGSDYVTIDGIDIRDNNSANPATMEYGIALYKASASNGCQHNIIRNCTITLNRINNTQGVQGLEGSTAIAVLNALRATPGITFTPASADGTNSYNQFYSNTIQNCNMGIGIVGYNDANAALYLLDTDNTIGGTGPGSGNTIINFGGPTTAGRQASGIYSIGQSNLNCSYNLINSNNGQGFPHGDNVRGIYAMANNRSTTSVNSNTITLQMLPTATGKLMFPVEISIGNNNALVNNTVTISNNLIANCDVPGSTIANDFGGIRNTSAASVLNITQNRLSNNSLVAGGNFYGIQNINSISAVNTITDNSIDMGTYVSSATSFAGTISGIGNTMNNPNAFVVNISRNTFRNLLLAPGAPTTCSITTAISMINVGDGISTGSLVVNKNRMENLDVPSASDVFFINANTAINYGSIRVDSNAIVTGFTKRFSGGTVAGYYSVQNMNGTLSLTGNNFSNVTLTGNTYFVGIRTNNANTNTNLISITGNRVSQIISGDASYLYGTLSGGGIMTVQSNTITAVTGGGSMYAIHFTNGKILKISNNQISNLSGTANSTYIVGINVEGGSATVYNNRVFGLSSGNINSVYVTGLYLSGATACMYNNIITDLTAPNTNAANGVMGISVLNNAVLSAYYNTVYLAAVSSNTLFGTSAVSTTNNVSRIDLRNNIFVNKSTPVGTGLTVVHRRGTTSLATLDTNTNNNLYYAGIPDAQHLIFNDGTNSDQTLADYKTRFSTTTHTSMEQASVTEDPLFTSTVTSSPDLLHFSPGTLSYSESGAMPIPGVFTDMDSLIRQGNPGYAGTGLAPDMGAVEFEGVIPVAVKMDSLKTVPTATTLCSASERTISVVITPGNSPIQYAVLRYAIDGVVQPTLAMSSPDPTIVSTWTTTIPVPTPASGKITWSVYTKDGIVTQKLKGIPYADEPLLGFTLGTPSISSPMICKGSPLVLEAIAKESLKLSAVGSGTTSSSDVATSPFNNWGGGQKAQYLYTAAELNAAGLRKGDITSIALDVSSLGQLTSFSDFAISLGTTTQTVYTSATPVTGLNGYYSNASQTVTTGVNTFSLNTAFYWDGSSNLIVQFCYSNNNAGSGAVTSSAVKCSNTSSNKSMALYGDFVSASYICSATIPPVTGGGIITNFRPNIVFGTHLYSQTLTASWSDANGIVDTLNPATVTVISPSTYTVVLTEANGCSLTAVSPSVGITPAPLITAVASNTSFCAGSTVTLSASGTDTYTWMPGALVGDSITVNVNSTTTYTARGTDTTNGCTAIAQISLIPDPLPIVVPAASATTLCAGSSVHASATGATTYTWMPGNMHSDWVTLSPPGDTTYSIIGTGANGCVSDTAFLTFHIKPLPVVASSVSSTTLCIGSSVYASANGAATYTWMPGAATGAWVTLSPASTTEYTVTGTDTNGCQATAALLLGVNQGPSITVSASGTLICTGSSTELTATGADTYTWTPGGATTATVSVNPATTTVYTVLGSVAGAECAGINSLTIAVTPCTGIEENDHARAIRLYPNPSNGNITLQMDQMPATSVITLNVLDLNGRLVHAQTIDQPETQIHLSSLARGMYYVEISIDRNVAQRSKLVIE